MKVYKVLIIKLVVLVLCSAIPLRRKAPDTRELVDEFVRFLDRDDKTADDDEYFDVLEDFSSDKKTLQEAFDESIAMKKLRKPIIVRRIPLRIIFPEGMQSDGIVEASSINIDSSRSRERIDIARSGKHNAERKENERREEPPAVSKSSLKKELNPADFVRARSKPWVGDFEFINARHRSINGKVHANPLESKKTRRLKDDSSEEEKFMEEWKEIEKQTLLMKKDRKECESSSTSRKPSNTTKPTLKGAMNQIVFGGVLSKLKRMLEFFLVLI